MSQALISSLVQLFDAADALGVDVTVFESRIACAPLALKSWSLQHAHAIEERGDTFGADAPPPLQGKSWRVLHCRRVTVHLDDREPASAQVPA